MTNTPVSLRQRMSTRLFEFKRLRPFFGFVLLSLTAFAAKPTTSAVVIEKPSPHVLRKTFERNNLPPEMPTLTPFETGLCDHRFSCETNFQVSMPSITHGNAPATVTSITLRTGLEIVIWTEVKTTEKVIAHEEAHREIAEHYYRRADAIARRLAENAIGRKVQVEIRNGKPDLEPALRNLQNKLVAKYLDETAHRCIFAQNRFDQITDHSRDPISEQEAMTQALGEEEIHYAKES